MLRFPQDTPREPKIYIGPRARELGRMIVEEESVHANPVELVFKTPLYVGTNGNCDVLTRYACESDSKRTVTSIRGYLGEAALTLLYGSRQDFIVLHKEKPTVAPPANEVDDGKLEGSMPLEEVMQLLEGEMSLEARVGASLGNNYQPPEEQTPYQLRRQQVLMSRMTRTLAREERIKMKEMLRTDPKYKGATVVPFSEIKDFRIVT